MAGYSTYPCMRVHVCQIIHSVSYGPFGLALSMSATVLRSCLADVSRPAAIPIVPPAGQEARRDILQNFRGCGLRFAFALRM